MHRLLADSIMWVNHGSHCCGVIVQATEKVMEMYREASEVQDASASSEEAGKAAMQLANLCDELLKVRPSSAVCFCGGNLSEGQMQSSES